MKHEIKVPKRIKIGGIDYKVKADTEARHELSSHSWRGSSSSVKREILIHNSDVYNQQDKSVTFLHELLHSISDVYCANHVAEDDVDGLANGLHQVLEKFGIRFVL